MMRSQKAFRTKFLLLAVIAKFLQNVSANGRSPYEQSANPVMPESMMPKNVGVNKVAIEEMNVEVAILL
jgi:hypothetical protein